MRRGRADLIEAGLNEGAERARTEAAMGFVCGGLGLLSLWLGAKRGELDGFDERSGVRWGSLARTGRRIGVGYTSRRRDGANCFAGRRLAAQLDRREARWSVGSPRLRSRSVAPKRRCPGPGPLTTAGKVDDDPHKSAAFRTGRRSEAGSFLRCGCWFFISARCRLDLVRQERAAQGELFRAVAIGQETEVADAVEAVGARCEAGNAG